jgi:hypothetical protein
MRIRNTIFTSLNPDPHIPDADPGDQNHADP